MGEVCVHVDRARGQTSASSVGPVEVYERGVGDAGRTIVDHPTAFVAGQDTG